MRRSPLAGVRRASCGPSRGAAGRPVQGLQLRQAALAVVAAWLLLDRCAGIYAETLSTSAVAFWCSSDRGCAALCRRAKGKHTASPAAANADNSSRAGERDVLWTDAGFSAAFWGSQVERYFIDLKTQLTALKGVIGSHNTSREPCCFSNNYRAQHLLRLGSQQANGLYIYG